MSEPNSDPKLTGLEKSLAALVPVPGRIDRDQLLFRAGQASVRHHLWLWPTAAALMAIVAVSLGMVLAWRPGPMTMERIVYVPVPQPSAAASDAVVTPAPSVAPESSSAMDTGDYWASSSEYLRERNLAIRWGVDALPPPPSTGSFDRAPTIESMLGLPERKANQASPFSLRF
jgi:hypothetical protein